MGRECRITHAWFSGRPAHVFVLLLLMVLLVLAGCWDHREVEDLGLVLLTAVDAAPEDRIRVEVQTLVPGALAGGGGGVGGMGGGGRGGGRKPYRNFVAEARTVFNAFRQLSMEAPRRLFFAHNQVIIISEKLARERGVSPVLDFFDRNREIRRDTWILVARGELKEIIDVPGHMDVIPAQRIIGLINNRQLSSHFAINRLGDFIEMLESPGIEPYTAIIGMTPNKAMSRVGLQPGTVGVEPSHNIRLTGAAVFRRDRLVGWLDERESRGLLWVRGEVRGGPVTFSLPDARDGRNIAVEILRAGRGGVKLEPRLAGGQLSMTVKIDTRVNLVESQALGIDLTNPQVISRLEKQLAAAIKQGITACVTRLQEDYMADALGFGEAVHRKYPRVWRQIEGEWEYVFASMPVTVEVKTSIRRTGLINKPMQPSRRWEAALIFYNKENALSFQKEGDVCWRSLCSAWSLSSSSPCRFRPW